MDIKKIMLCAFCWVLGIPSLVCAIPIVQSVFPSSGAIAGGDAVIITGSGFNGAANVDFGQRAATSFTVINDTKISATVPTGTVGTVDVQVTVMSQASPVSNNDYYTYTAESWEGIVSGTTPDQVALFSTSTNTFDTLIPLLSLSLGSVITPDGTRIYTADSNIPGVTVIDAATNTILTSIPTSVGTGAFDIIVNPSGTRVYVSNESSGYVTVVDITTNTVVTDLFLGGNPGPLSITPDGSTVYVSNFFFGNITPINTATNTIGTSISTGISPGMISITPDGTKAFVCNLFSNTISVIDLATQTLVNTIAMPSGAGPYGSSILPNGLTMYVANIFNSTVTTVDVASETITSTIPLMADLNPFWVASTPDSKSVFIINEVNDEVTPIDVATNIVGAAFGGIGGNLQDLVISPDPAPVARFTAVAQLVNVPTSFDASASLSPIGTIVSYAWDFGDGFTATTSSPFINHTYITAQAFDVTLTVTNSAGTSTTQVFSSRFMSNDGGPSATITQTVEAIPLPPTHLKGCQHRHSCKVENILCWAPPASGGIPASYRIFRNSKLIGVVPGNGPLRFIDKPIQRNKSYTYAVVSVSPSGVLSAPAIVTIP